MQRIGHIGGAMLFSAMLSAQLGLSPVHSLLLSIVASSVAMFPDEDLKWHSHRGFTHSLVFLALLSSLSGLLGCAIWKIMPSQLGWAWWPPPLSSLTCLQVFLACSVPITIGAGSHLFFDLMTKTGVPLLWPFRKRYSMKLFRSSNPFANYGLAALGIISLILSLRIFI